ncbi:hypothetical protein GCM10023187_41950 [Nibrella viscosa]|uniref:Uncharacterized protein n=1 Tax=Nibrella viscosa TaxID=1084524 RepID=A0ABP8KRI1_9BACT
MQGRFIGAQLPVEGRHNPVPADEHFAGALGVFGFVEPIEHGAVVEKNQKHKTSYEQEHVEKQGHSEAVWAERYTLIRK